MTAVPATTKSLSPAAEKVARECFLIHDALTFEQQVALSEYIASRDRTPPNEPRAMVPAPRTLVLGEDGVSPSVTYRRGDGSIMTRMGDAGGEGLERAGLGLESSETADVTRYTKLSMATIRYEAPNGQFPPHVDHCGESAVFLVSLGRSANFMVRGKGERDVKRLSLRSGDALVFDASTEAGVLHGVESIDENASKNGEALAGCFPVFQNHRYGVQCRMYFS